MIGRIRFEWAGETLAAELGDDRRWACDHPAYGAQLAGWLQALFDPADRPSPSAGLPGRAAIEAAAAWLETADVEFPDPDTDPDTEGPRDAIY